MLISIRSVVTYLLDKHLKFHGSPQQQNPRKIGIHEYYRNHSKLIYFQSINKNCLNIKIYFFIFFSNKLNL